MIYLGLKILMNIHEIISYTHLLLTFLFTFFTIRKFLSLSNYSIYTCKRNKTLVIHDIGIRNLIWHLTFDLNLIRICKFKSAFFWFDSNLIRFDSKILNLIGQFDKYSIFDLNFIRIWFEPDSIWQIQIGFIFDLIWVWGTLHP